MTQPQAPYTIRVKDPERRSFTGSADNIVAALQAAWGLNRHSEGDVEIVDHRDEPAGRVVAEVSVKWLDGE